jgi:hypothetical protein
MRQTETAATGQVQRRSGRLGGLVWGRFAESADRARPRSMAYIFELQSDPLDPPFVGLFDVETVEFALGYDVDAEKVVLMSVMRIPRRSEWQKLLVPQFNSD